MELVEITERDAEKAGESAAHQYLPITSNPFDAVTHASLHEAWLRGYEKVGAL